MEALAQALSPLAPIAPVRNGRRTEGEPLGRAGAGLSGAGHIEHNALKIVSSRDRAQIVSSAQSALGVIRGKWKIPILVTMLDRPVRLGQLRRLIPRASKKILVQQLHELERDGIIVRADLSGKIKHVEYTISVPLGMAVINLLGMLSEWESGARPLWRCKAPLKPVQGRPQITL
jgi:DNA-binding HxlR family transcriptional regulator